MSLAALVGTSQGASADAPTLGMDGVLRYHYYSKYIGPVRCSPNNVCSIVLRPGEELKRVSIGDFDHWNPESFSVDTQEGTVFHVQFKPKASDLTTNLILITTDREYDIVLQATKSTNHHLIGFFYPAPRPRQKEVAVVLTLPQPTQAPSFGLDDLSKVDRRYRVDGQAPFRPTNVFNDQKHTFIYVPENLSDAPVLYQVGPDSLDSLVNYRVRDNVYMADGTPDKLVLVTGGSLGKTETRVVITRGK